jgi:F420H(2)-dependent quinone reductase
VATAEERARLWPSIVERFPNYAGYQRKTMREIPLVILEPVGAEMGAPGG